MSSKAGRLTSLEADALEVNSQRKKGIKVQQKASLPSAISKPRAKGAERKGVATFRQQWTKTATGLGEEEQRKAVLQAIEVFKQLPAGSSYAQHRLKVLHQALGLLDKDRRAGMLFPRFCASALLSAVPPTSLSRRAIVAGTRGPLTSRTSCKSCCSNSRFRWSLEDCRFSEGKRCSL
jgi:hypothetical protein